MDLNGSIWHKNYQNNEYLRWQISVYPPCNENVLGYLDFNTEKYYDFVTIFNGVEGEDHGGYTGGTMRNDIYSGIGVIELSLSNYFEVVFTSDSIIPSDGFHLSWACPEPAELSHASNHVIQSGINWSCIQEICPGDLPVPVIFETGVEGILDLIPYENYQGTIIWEIYTICPYILIQSIFFDTETNIDMLSINARNFTGEIYTESQFTFSGNTSISKLLNIGYEMDLPNTLVIVQFISNSVITGHEFQIDIICIQSFDSIRYQLELHTRNMSWRSSRAGNN